MADIYKHSIWKEILITQLNIYDMEAEDINYKEQDRNAILAYLAGGKCTQVDARELPDSVYIKYLHLLEKEFEIIKPKVIILFGNQVSSIVLDKKISVSQVRKQPFIKKINGNEYKFYSVYYPVGNGRFNIDKSIEDIKWIMENDIHHQR